MEVEISVEAEKKRLNSWVALTVVLLSVLMGLGKLKDDNIVQTRQLLKADAADAWSEYQAKKIKLHLTEAGLRQAEMLVLANPASAAALKPQQQQLRQEISRYKQESEALQRKAEGKEQGFEALNARHDLFDISDAALSIAVACAAVAALSANLLPLFAAWGFGALGMVFWLAGFAGWNLRIEWLVSLLG
ncbi:DUF4337 domain-containing protein [Chromobacterium sp. IIBBL 290-4]|uniref:DUF4337 domain-containing protein n=1 Tax=Chromobacterium sp. IIBBL 290-4 TaxID=2953890 RepID=UPI0020B66E99|nr:DUF4337 domain-containing protein [Chromobacterium sp. IIBBL 290-4]UTH75961.1 DUF4337 domain-containing protein [Chromobacterium sp. IIBBL 290-4]